MLYEGEQNVLPQNMPLWHTDYFELKLLENQLAQGHSYCPTPSWKQEIKLLRERYNVPEGKRHSYH